MGVEIIVLIGPFFFGPSPQELRVQRGRLFVMESPDPHFWACLSLLSLVEARQIGVGTPGECFSYSHPRKERNRFVPTTANRMQMVEKVTHSDVHGHDSSSLRATTMKEVGSFDGAFVHYLSSGVVSPDEMFLKEERPLLPQTWGFYGNFNEKHFTFVHLMLLNLQGSFPRTTSYRE